MEALQGESTKKGDARKRDVSLLNGKCAKHERKWCVGHSSYE